MHSRSDKLNFKKIKIEKVNEPLESRFQKNDYSIKLFSTDVCINTNYCM